MEEQLRKMDKATGIVNYTGSILALAYSLILIAFTIIGSGLGKTEFLTYYQMLTGVPYYWVFLFILMLPLMIVFTTKYIKYAKNFDRTDNRKPKFPRYATKSGIISLFAGVTFLASIFITYLILTNTGQIVETGLSVTMIAVFVIFAFSLVNIICLTEIKDAHTGKKEPEIPEELEDEEID